MRAIHKNAHRTEGFTLIEVLVVMAIISVLMGFGIGMFLNLSAVGKSTQAQNTILETIHAVKNSSRGYGAALVVDPTQKSVYGLEFRTVLSSNFEAEPDGESTVITGLGYKEGTPRGPATLQPYPEGHTGGGWVSEGATIDWGNFPDYDLVEGVSIDLWIYPTMNRSMDLITKGDAFGLRLRKGGGAPVVEAFLSLRDPKDPQQKRRPNKERYRLDDPLRMNRWNRIILSYDRNEVKISVDSTGRGAVLRLTKKETKPIWRDEDAHLMVGGDSPFIGKMDDLKISGIIAGDPRPLPEEITIEGDKPRVIRFVDKKLDPAHHRGPETIVVINEAGVPNPITIGLLGNILIK